MTYRTNNALIHDFPITSLNQVAAIARNGTLTVAGVTTRGATNVTVNTLTATRYADNTFVKEGFTLEVGTNTFTANAQDALGRSDAHTISTYLPTKSLPSYDANGNTRYDWQRAFDWDDENQLIRVTVTNAWKSEFTYDGKMRRRVRKEYSWQNSVWVLTNEVRYVFDGMLVLQERDGNNVPAVTCTRGRDFSGGLEEAGGIGGLLARTDNGRLITGHPQPHAYYHSDGSGNIVALINSNQVAVATYLYDPFGKPLAISGPLANANAYRFSSMLAHQPSDLVLYSSRAYEPNLQRWLSPEPYGDRASLGGQPPVFDKAELLPDGPNLYRFALNSPQVYVDQDGRLAGPVVIGGLVALRVCWMIPSCKAAVIRGAAYGVATGLAAICKPKKERDCDKEWEDARQRCAEELAKPNPARSVTGGYSNIEDCAKGLVSEECGGNLVEHPQKRKPR